MSCSAILARSWIGGTGTPPATPATRLPWHGHRPHSSRSVLGPTLQMARGLKHWESFHGDLMGIWWGYEKHWKTLKNTMVKGLVKEKMWNWKSFECVSYAPNIGLSSKAFQFQFSVQPFLGLVVFALSNQEDDWNTPRIGWDHEMVSGWTYQNPLLFASAQGPCLCEALLLLEAAERRNGMYLDHSTELVLVSRDNRAIMSHQYMWHHEIQELGP